MNKFAHFRYVVHTDNFIPMHDNPRAGWFGHTMHGTIWYPTEARALAALRRCYACDRGNKRWQFGCTASVATITRYFEKRGYTVQLQSQEL